MWKVHKLSEYSLINVLTIYLYILSFVFFLYSYTHMCIHCFSYFSPLPQLSPSPSDHLTSRQNLVCPFLQFCWIEDVSNNKKNKAFAIWDKDSNKEKFLALLPCRSVLQHELIHLYLTSSLPWLPSHIDLCCFKFTVLAPLQWGHHTLWSFGFLPIPIPPA
jgi:hypothetical protein